MCSWLVCSLCVCVCVCVWNFSREVKLVPAFHMFMTSFQVLDLRYFDLGIWNQFCDSFYRVLLAFGTRQLVLLDFIDFWPLTFGI